MTVEQKARIDAMSHRELCSLWRFAEVDEPLLQGSAGEYFQTRLFDHFGGFNPQLSKSIGWDKP